MLVVWEESEIGRISGVEKGNLLEVMQWSARFEGADPDVDYKKKKSEQQ